MFHYESKSWYNILNKILSFKRINKLFSDLLIIYKYFGLINVFKIVKFILFIILSFYRFKSFVDTFPVYNVRSILNVFRFLAFRVNIVHRKRIDCIIRPYRKLGGKDNNGSRKTR